MYRLFGSPGTASFTPEAVLAEADLAHELVRIDIGRGEHRRPAYLEICPAGVVPAMTLPSGETIAEALAICLHLAETHGLTAVAPAPGDPERPRFLSALFYLATSVQPVYKRFYYPERFSPRAEDSARIKERAVAAALEAWAPVDARLAAGGPYHLGARASLVDLYALSLSLWHPPREALLEAFPALAACVSRVAARPALAECLARHAVVGVGAPRAP